MDLHWVILSPFFCWFPWDHVYALHFVESLFKIESLKTVQSELAHKGLKTYGLGFISIMVKSTE